jgi:hypothetical protein
MQISPINRYKSSNQIQQYLKKDNLQTFSHFSNKIRIQLGVVVHCMAVIPRRLRLEDLEFSASLDYIVRPLLKNNK